MKNLKVVIGVLTAVTGAVLLGVFTLLGNMLLPDSILGGIAGLYPLLLVALLLLLIGLKRHRKESKPRKGEYVLLLVYVAVAAVFCRGFVHYVGMKGDVDALVRMGKEDIDLMLSCVPDSVVSELDDFKASCENILESRDVLKFLELSEILEDEAGVLNAQ